MAAETASEDPASGEADQGSPAPDTTASEASTEVDGDGTEPSTEQSRRSTEVPTASGPAEATSPSEEAPTLTLDSLLAPDDDEVDEESPTRVSRKPALGGAVTLIPTEGPVARPAPARRSEAEVDEHAKTRIFEPAEVAAMMDDRDDDAAAEAEAVVLPESFDELDLPEAVRSAVATMGWTTPTPVQALTFPLVTNGRDVLVQSQTGSGKTGAFCLPWLAQRFEAGDAAKTGVQLLVLTPTRELAKQVCEQLQQMARATEVVTLPIYGGTAMQPQLQALRDGVHAVVGTPGRILDHIRRRSLKLDRVRMAVLDEADEMLSMGFLEDIHAILDACSTERQTCLFSATVPPDIERIARRYMRDPESVMLSGDQVAAAEIQHVYYQVSGTIKVRDLLDMISIEEPPNGLVFCNTREETYMVASALRREGFHAEPLSSDLTQAARERVMGRMRTGQLRFLVATDVASRGIDISHIGHVINYSFPENAESYVHRTGRTGRAGRPGVAISLIAPQELGNHYYLKLQYPSIEFEERALPPAAEMAAQRLETKLDQVSRLFPELVAPEWTLLTRHLVSDPRGEQVVAYLLKEAMTRVAREREQDHDSDIELRRPRGDGDRRGRGRGRRDRFDRDDRGDRDRYGRGRGRWEDEPDDDRRGPRRDEAIDEGAGADGDDRRRRRRRGRRDERDGPEQEGRREERGRRGRRDERDGPGQEGRREEGRERRDEREGRTERRDDRDDGRRDGERRRRRRRRNAEVRSDDAPPAESAEVGPTEQASPAGDASPADIAEDSSAAGQPSETEASVEPAEAASGDAAASGVDTDAGEQTAKDAGEEAAGDESDADPAFVDADTGDETAKDASEEAAAEAADDMAAEATDGTEGEGEGGGRRRRRRRRRRRGREKTGEVGEPSPEEPVVRGETEAPVPNAAFAPADAEPGQALDDASESDEAEAEAEADDGQVVEAQPGSEPINDPGTMTGLTRRRRRRRRRRGRRSEEGAGESEATDASPEASQSEGEVADGEDSDELAELTDEGASDDGKRRRRRRRGGRRRKGEAKAPEPPSSPGPVHVSQEQIVIDIDESELEVVRDQFGEIDELDELTLKGRRRGVMDVLQDEVELEDLSAADRDTEEADDDNGDDDNGDDADDADDGAEDEASEADEEAEAKADVAPDSREAKKRKRRRRRRKKKVPPPPPELTAPPHKDFWEVWATRFTYRDFEDDTYMGGAAAVPEEPEPKPEPEPPTMPAVEDEDTFVRIRLNVGRKHGKKAAHVRELLAESFGLARKAVRDLTVGDASSRFRLGAKALVKLEEIIEGFVFDGIELKVTRLEPVPSQEPAETASEAQDADGDADCAAQAPAEAPEEADGEADSPAQAEAQADAPAEVAAADDDVESPAPAEAQAEAPAEVTASDDADPPAQAQAPSEVTAADGEADAPAPGEASSDGDADAPPTETAEDTTKTDEAAEPSDAEQAEPSS